MSVLAALLRSYRARSALMLVALLVAGVAEGISLSALLPLLSLATGDADTGGLSRLVLGAFERVSLPPTIGALLSVIVFGVLLKSALLLFANRQVGFTVARVASDLRVRLINALVQSEWSYFLAHRSGTLANAIASEAYRAATGFEYAARTIALTLQATVYLAVAMFVSWQATLLAIACGAVLLLALRALLRLAHRAGVRQTRLLRTLLADLTEMLGAGKALKAMARDRVAETALKSRSVELEQAARQEVTSKEALRALQEPLLAVVGALGLYAALVHWGLKLSAVMVLVFLLVRLLGLVNKVQRQYQLVLTQQSALTALESAITSAEAAREVHGGTTAPPRDVEISLQRVAVDFDGYTVFDELSARIPCRALTVICGPSGQGKSTLLDVLCGLVTPSSGRMNIGGLDFADVNLRAWRSRIGYVPQDPVLLHDSIVNNVVVGDPRLDAARARDALQRVGLLASLVALPAGLDSVVGERGGKLSGGQRQRVAIARALAHSPDWLILDEPTSALDDVSAAAIINLLQELSDEVTVVVATHDMALVAAADHLITLGADRRAAAVR